MNMHDFDGKVRKALENLEIPYDENSWTVFENRLDKGIAGDQAFDEIISARLNAVQDRFDPGSWNILEQKIKDRRIIRRNIRLTRLAEAAILLLLLLSFDQWLGDLNSGKPDQKRREPVASSLKGMKNENKTQNHSGSETPLKADQEIFVPAYYLIPGGNFSEINEDSLFKTIPYFQEPIAASGLNEGFPENVQFQSIPELAGLVPVFLADPLPSPNYPIPASRAISPRTPKGFYAFIQVSDDWSRVYSTSSTRPVQGYSFGAGVGVKKGRMALETGIGYARRHYQPQRVVTILSGDWTKGYYGAIQTEVDADIVTIPARVLYRVGRVGLVSIHACAGATANIALQRDQHYRTVFYPGSTPDPGSNTKPQVPAISRAGSRGVAEGGNLKSNFYATADLGVRVSHPVSRRMAAFVEPSYHHTIYGNGLGASPSRIHTVGVTMGLTAKL